MRSLVRTTWLILQPFRLIDSVVRGASSRQGGARFAPLPGPGNDRRSSRCKPFSGFSRSGDGEMKRAGGFACLVAVGFAGCDAGPEVSNVDTSDGPIYGGSDVSPGLVLRSTGVVAILEPSGAFICTGTLVTPNWVLGALSCFPDVGDVVSLGNVGDSSAPSATIAQVIPHPSFSDPPGECNQAFDVILLRLSAPIYLPKPNGVVFEGYRRDLFRGSLSEIESGTPVDIYGYGGNGSSVESTANVGVLRFAINETEDLLTNLLQYDRVSLGEFRRGDAGGPVFLPSHGSPGGFEDYEIVAVHSKFCRANSDTSYLGTRADLITNWFDSSIGTGLLSFDAPSQIMTVLSAM